MRTSNSRRTCWSSWPIGVHLLPSWASGLTLAFLLFGPQRAACDLTCGPGDESPLSAPGETINPLGPHGALFIFARFTDGVDVDGLDLEGNPIPLPECSGCGEGWPAGETDLPSWAHDMLEYDTDPQIPGSLSHYFDAMSGGEHQLLGETLDQVIVSDLSLQQLNSVAGGGITGANKHILEKVASIYGAEFLAQFDLNSPGGGPDGVVDYVFIHYQSTRGLSQRLDGTYVYYPPLFPGVAAVSKLQLLDDLVFTYGNGQEIRIKDEGGCFIQSIRQHPPGQAPVLVRHPWMLLAVAAHEYGHDLNAVGGICGGGHLTTESCYGLMNGSMTPPVMMMSSIMRYKLGWIDPPVIPFPQSFPYDTTITLSADYEDENDCFALVRTHISDPAPPKASQYFLLEARRPNLPGQVYNSANPLDEFPNCCYPMREVGEGLLIAHIRDDGGCCYVLDDPPWDRDYPPPLFNVEVATGLYNLGTGVPDPLRGLNRLLSDSRKSCGLQGLTSEGPASGQIGDLFRPKAGGAEYFSNLFTPFTNPNTNLYVDEPATIPTAQTIYSGISFHDIEWIGASNEIQIRLHIDDPANPPPAGGADTLRTSMTVDVLLQLTGDLAVLPDAALTLKPGSVVVAAADQDRHAGGAASSLAELIGLGPVWAQGTSSSPVKFIPSTSDAFDDQAFRYGWPGFPLPHAADPSPGDWFGFRMKSSDLASQSTIDFGDFEFARIAVSVDSLSGKLFHPKFTGSEISDIRFDRDFRVPADKRWVIDAPAVAMISNSDAGSSGGDAARVEGLVEGDFETSSANPGVDRVTIRPETLTPTTGDAWAGFQVLPGGKFKLRDADLGYAQRPIQLFGADSSEVVRSYVHHYEAEGILDWETHASILNSRVERGAGLDGGLGMIGIHLASSRGTVSADTIGAHIEYGIKAEFASGTCAIPGLTPLGTLTITGNRLVADSEPDNGDGDDVGLFASWVCDSISAVIDQNLIRYWTRGMSLDHCADVSVTCNTIEDNFTGALYNRDVGMPINSRNGLVKFNQNALKSSFDSGITIPVGLGLRIGNSGSPPDPGRNALRLDSDDDSRFLRVVVADPFIGFATLDARRETWIKPDGSITQDDNFVQSKIAEDFAFQVNAGLKRSTETLCTSMPGAARHVPREDSVEEDAPESSPGLFSLESSLRLPGRVRSGESVPIEFVVPAGARLAAIVDVFDVRGARVRRLHAEIPGGSERTFTWNGRNEHGHLVAPQILFLRVEAAGQSVTRKLLVLR